VLDYELDHKHEDAKALFIATLVDEVDENGEFKRDEKGFI